MSGAIPEALAASGTSGEPQEQYATVNSKRAARRGLRGSQTLAEDLLIPLVASVPPILASS